MSFCLAGSGIERLESLCLLSASMPVDVSQDHSGQPSTPLPDSSTNGGYSSDPGDGDGPTDPGSPPSDPGSPPSDPGNPPSGSDPDSPPNSGGQTDPGAFLPDPNNDGDSTNAPSVTQDQFNGYLGGVESNFNSSWALSQQDTIKRVGPDSAQMTSNLNIDRDKLLKQIDQRTTELRGVYARLVQINGLVTDLFQAEANRYLDMTPDQRQSPQGQNLRMRMNIESGICDKINKICQSVLDEIESLKQYKQRVNDAFDRAVDSIRKDFGTSGGPGHEIYQNDDFYFV